MLYVLRITLTFSHVAPLGLLCLVAPVFYKHVAPLGLTADAHPLRLASVSGILAGVVRIIAKCHTAMDRDSRNLTGHSAGASQHSRAHAMYLFVGSLIATSRVNLS